MFARPPCTRRSGCYCARAEGRVAFEYDRPVTTFGQFEKPEVDGVASGLDDQLRSALAVAAG